MAGTKNRSGGARPNSGGARAGAGRPRSPAVLIDTPITTDPLAFLLAVMNDASADVKLRADAAKALLPFMHHKASEQGKKDAAKDAAKQAAVGRFAAAAPPLHIVR